MFKKLAEKLKTNTWDKRFSTVSSPLAGEGEFLKSQSKHALSLFERQVDINNFKKLVLSDPDNKSHEEIVDALFREQGISNPFSEDAIFNLSENKRFLEDLGL